VTTMQHEDSLWHRVAALRGIEVSKLRERGHLLGERFQVHASRDDAPTTPEAERVFRLVGDGSGEGVVGEIVPRKGRERRSTLATGVSAQGRGGPAPTTPLGWRRALIVREAERLARHQLERRARGLAEPDQADRAG
jgi:hypothetical protein